ncbi:MAG: hypothetical protein ABR552_04410 [Actinomycetota bacterium]|nr:hypothetical protein [Actinomycetota bacterium]
MKKAMLLFALLSMAVGSRAFAVSDGNYSYAAMHCSGHASNSAEGWYTEEGCHTLSVTVGDSGGHEYFGVGYDHTPEGAKGLVPFRAPGYAFGANLQRADVWTDTGDGCNRTVVHFTDDQGTASPSTSKDACPWMDPNAPNYWPQFEAVPDPASGIKIYFGDDDNSDGGEHDSSPYVQNGASDGGGAHFELSPSQVSDWVAGVMTADPTFVLRHPLPAGDAGLGFCADGICFSMQTQRRVVYQGGGDGERDAANYDGVTWDPSRCSGATGSDDAAHCGGHDLSWWNDQVGTVYAEPGVQIYEDPDPEGSPIGPYPLWGIYVGTCGVIAQGPMAFPASPYTNSAGQLVLTDRALTGGAIGC